MECQFCKQSLPEKAKFCFKCRQQIICAECGELLVQGADMCVYCGAPLKRTSSCPVSPNHIKFSETTTERQFEASFSDETAGNVVETLTGFLSLNRQRKQLFSIGNTSIEDISEVEIKEPIAIADTPASPLPTCSDTSPNCNNSLSDRLSKIFKKKIDGTISLYMTDLKANSKVDFAFRASLLYVYFQQEIAQISEVPKSEVNSFLASLGLKNDGSYRNKMSQMKSMFSSVSSTYTLSFAGETEASKYIEEILDPTTSGSWVIGNLSKPNTQSHGNGKKSVKSSPSMVINLNLSPKGQESLKDFIEKRDANNARKLNAVFVYYLQKIAGVENITPDHIYTCFKQMGIKVPTNMPQSLFDTKHAKGWIDTSNLNDIKISPAGENFVEHDSLK